MWQPKVVEGLWNLYHLPWCLAWCWQGSGWHTYSSVSIILKLFGHWRPLPSEFCRCGPWDLGKSVLVLITSFLGWTVKRKGILRTLQGLKKQSLNIIREYVRNYINHQAVHGWVLQTYISFTYNAFQTHGAQPDKGVREVQVTLPSSLTPVFQNFVPWCLW